MAGNIFPSYVYFFILCFVLGTLCFAYAVFLTIYSVNQKWSHMLYVLWNNCSKYQYTASIKDYQWLWLQIICLSNDLSICQEMHIDKHSANLHATLSSSFSKCVISCISCIFLSLFVINFEKNVEFL